MNRDVPLADLLACAVSAAHTAGTYARRHASRRAIRVKTFKHDVKLRLDLECQAKAEKVIRSHFPDHLMLGEEDSTTRSSAPPDTAYQWIIDPIDGTVNFSHGLPLWCCSVAVRRGPVVLAGAVYAPALEELYTATVKQPSTCNGLRILVSTVDRLDGAVILTGLDKHPDSSVPPFAIFESLSHSVQKTRVLGSAALDLCWVASGRADGYFEKGIYIWDVAAAGLIVQQAGGKGEILKHLGGNRLSFIASNGRIHSSLKKRVAV